MSFNGELAGAFEDIARLMELAGEDRFKINAHAKAARVVADYPEDLKAIAGDPAALTKIEGIGAKIAAKIAEFAASRQISEREELLKKVPAGLLDVMRVPGLGPKTAKSLWEVLGVTGLADLKRVIADGSILSVPRMGAKSVEGFRKGIETIERGDERMSIGLAMPIAEMLVKRLSAVPGVERVQFAGSLRRGRETIGDIDLLAIAPGEAAERLRQAFVTMPEVDRVLAQGETKCSVVLRIDRKFVQSDLRIVPAASWGAALMYFTGSKEHNVRLRERALKRGVTLNEYGLFTVDDDETPHQHRPGGLERSLAGKSEEEVFAALEVAYMPPEFRESLGDWPAETPRLIEMGDIRSELHAHTTASDGRMTIVQLAEHAKARGFHTVAVTDHSKSSALAGGLSEERLRGHIKAVREAASQVSGISILAGSEVDILVDGTLDYPDELLAELDVVVASPHASLSQEPGKATERLLRAITHPLVHILGHPTGRLIGHRHGLEPDMGELCSAAAEHGVAMEINANWQRLDLRDSHVRLALSRGCVIAINCDVHRPEDSDNLRFGVLTGRRGGLTPDRCVNAWDKAKLGEWLRRKRR